MHETHADTALLTTFVAVADEQSFTKAARKLGIGKGTVSRAIALLEEPRGAARLHRTTPAVALSTAGVALYERVAPHIAALNQAVQKLPERAAVPSGELRLTAPQDIAQVILPEVLTQFARRYPEVRVDLRATNRQVDLVAEGFDIAIRAATKMKDSTLTARRLAIGGLGSYAAPSYVARRGRPKRIGDADHDWIVHPFTRAALKLPAETVTRFQCDDFLVIRALARDGAGVGMMPRFVGTPYVNEGLLEDVGLAEPASLRAGLYLVWPSSGQVPRKVVAFREFFVEWLRKAPMG
jgi:DNA-binding transcriptional LysR family regulator